jgi:hypothetical protein
VKVKALKNGSSYSGAIECAHRIPRDWFFIRPAGAADVIKISISYKTVAYPETHKQHAMAEADFG